MSPNTQPPQQPTPTPAQHPTAQVLRKPPASNPGIRPAAAPAQAPAPAHVQGRPAGGGREFHQTTTFTPKSTMRSASVNEDVSDPLPIYKPVQGRTDTLSLVSFERFGGFKNSIYIPGIRGGNVQYDPEDPACEPLLHYGEEPQERWGFIALVYRAIDQNCVPIPGAEGFSLQAFIVYKTAYEDLQNMFSILNRQTGERTESTVDFFVTGEANSKKKFDGVLSQEQDSACWLQWACRDQIIAQAEALMPRLDHHLGQVMSPQMVALKYQNYLTRKSNEAGGGRPGFGNRGAQPPRGPGRGWGPGRAQQAQPPVDSPAMEGQEGDVVGQQNDAGDVPF